MTFSEWLRECLHWEAVQTEPDSREAVRKATAEMEKRKKQMRPPPRSRAPDGSGSAENAPKNF